MTEVPNGSDLVTNPDRVLPFVAHVYASTCGRDENVSAAIFRKYHLDSLHIIMANSI